MTNIKKILTAIVLATTLTVSTGFAADGILVSNRDGILVSNRAEQTKKQQTCRATAKLNAGILVSNIIGILVSNFTGILVSNAVETVSCDQSKTGILVSN